MDEDTASLLARLALASGDTSIDFDIDVKELLDAVLLASAWVHSGSLYQAADESAQLEGGGQAGRTPPAEDTQARENDDATDTALDPAASVWLEDRTGTHTVSGKRVNMGRATALPNALDIGRALRPLRRRWLSGVHRRLDVDATVEHYTRTGMLIPQLTPAPEPWLEVIVVLDRGSAMPVWDETVRALTKTLRALAAFRDVRVWHLEHPPGGTPVLHDHYGNALPMHPDAAQHTQPTRRLLLVVTDCAAPGWRQDGPWRTLHTWGRTAPVALINPLPKRLWQRSGLDLPRTTATATVPASPCRLLSYRRPRLLRDTPDTKPWQALPVLQFDPAQVLAWARALMRTDPSGCEAVLVPATGRPPLRRRRPGSVTQPDLAPTNDQVRAHTEAFTDDRQSSAVRLAIAAFPLSSFTLPVLDVLRERLVPDATLADSAEFLTAGILTATRRESADTIYHFHPAAVGHLKSLLTRDQLWDTHFALSDHLADHVQAPYGIPVVLHSPHAETLPTGIRPIAYAAATTARLLGVEPTDQLPEIGRRPAADRPAGSSNKPPRVPAPTAGTPPIEPPLIQPSRAEDTSGTPLTAEERRTLIEALTRSPVGYSRDIYEVWIESVRLAINPRKLQASDSAPARNRLISVVNFALQQETPNVLRALADALELHGPEEEGVTDVRRLVDKAVDAWNGSQGTGIKPPRPDTAVPTKASKQALLTDPSPAGRADSNTEEQGQVRNRIHGPVAVSPATLPPRSPSFTGRSAEMARLLPGLAPAPDDDSTTLPLLVSAVTGMGGIGKTAFAVEAAHQAHRKGWFPGGILFVDLRGYDDHPVTADQAVLALLEALGVSGTDLPPTKARQYDMYRTVLAERRHRMLLILDNASAATQYLPLLPGTGHHRVLVTSRDRTDASPVRLVDLAALDPEESVALITRALHETDERDDRPAQEPEALRELTALCGHVPLALLTAAAMLRRRRHRDIATLVTEMKEAEAPTSVPALTRETGTEAMDSLANLDAEDALPTSVQFVNEQSLVDRYDDITTEGGNPNEVTRRRIRIGIVGHRNIPNTVLPSVRSGIRRVLQGNTSAEALSRLGAGADQLFADIALEHGVPLTAVIPGMDYEAHLDDDATRATYRRLLSSSRTRVNLPVEPTHEEAYFAAGRWIVDHVDRLIAVWDGFPASELDNTAGILNYARQTGVPVTVLWRPGVTRA